MIEVPIQNTSGEQVGTLTINEQDFGGEVRPVLLKQAYVRYHANRRQGSAKTRSRGQVSHSTHKLYRQKGTGNARRGDANANILRGGGHAKAKQPHSWRQDMPKKMRRMANRNALLAKLLDGEIKILDSFGLDKPSSKQFASLLKTLSIDRSCLLALGDTRGREGRSAANVADVTTTQIDRLNAFDLLNHRYVLATREDFEAYLNRVLQHTKKVKPGDPAQAPETDAKEVTQP